MNETIHANTINLGSPWNKVIGSVYTVASLARRIGVDEFKIAELQAKNRLLYLVTADEHAVFPAFQFTPEMKVLPGLLKVWSELRKAEVTDWTMASWLVSPLKRGGEESVLDILKENGNLKKALFEAREAVNAWMQ